MNYADLSVGDRVRVRIVNKRGDHNLDGAVLTGRIIELNDLHRMAKLDSGWCFHEKDELLMHDNTYGAKP